MEHYAAIDVSLEWSSVCVVDAAGQIVHEAKVRSEREALVAFFAESGLSIARIGGSAGRLIGRRVRLGWVEQPPASGDVGPPQEATIGVRVRARRQTSRWRSR